MKKMTKSFHICVDEDLYREIKCHTKKVGLSVSEFTRQSWSERQSKDNLMIGLRESYSRPPTITINDLQEV